MIGGGTLIALVTPIIALWINPISYGCVLFAIAIIIICFAIDLYAVIMSDMS